MPSGASGMVESWYVGRVGRVVRVTERLCIYLEEITSILLTFCPIVIQFIRFMPGTVLIDQAFCALRCEGCIVTCVREVSAYKFVSHASVQACAHTKKRAPIMHVHTHSVEREHTSSDQCFCQVLHHVFRASNKIHHVETLFIYQVGKLVGVIITFVQEEVGERARDRVIVQARVFVLIPGRFCAQESRWLKCCCCNRRRVGGGGLV